MSPRPSAGTSSSAAKALPADTDFALEALAGSDEVMASLIERYGSPEELRDARPERPTDAYGALVRAIVGQQLSTKAARTIFGRLTDLFGNRTPTPKELIATDPEQLRAVGLSRAKAAYLRDLALHVESGELEIDSLSGLDDERVIAELVAVKGLGRWTAEMFLIFHLGRPDVLPVGDLGVRKGAMIAYGLEALPDAETLERLGERWRPHRTIASLYLWRLLAED